MQVKIENMPQSRVKLFICIEKKDMQEYENTAYKKMVGQIKIAGFRPGKAPIAILKREVGDAKFQHEVMDVAIPQSYYKVIVDNKVQAIGQPEVKVAKFVPGDLLEFEADVAVLPAVILPDYKAMKVKIVETKINKSDIEGVLTNLRQEKAILKKVDRGAKKEDRVEIDFDGFIGGKPLTGGSSKNHPLVLGKKAFIPGFEEELIGLKVDENKEFDIKFPESYHAKELAGKEAHFIVKMNLVHEIELPEISDDFANQVGSFETVKKLKEDIGKNLSTAKSEENIRNAERALLEKIVLKSKMDIPVELIGQEAESLINDMETGLIQRGGTLDGFLESQNKSREDLSKDIREEAEKRVRVGLVLSQISKEEGIMVTESEVKAEVDKRIVGLPDAEEFRAKYLTDQNRKDIELQLFTRKTIERLMEYATLNK